MHLCKLLIFGNPKAGTPIMLASPLAALDLPLKILVWEKMDGSVWLSYNDSAYLQRRHALPDNLLGSISVVDAPQRIHFSECQKSGVPSRVDRPLSTSTMCNSPPFLGPLKCEVYCVSGVPSALRARRRRKTPMSSTRGTNFSIPMLAM